MLHDTVTPFSGLNVYVKVKDPMQISLLEGISAGLNPGEMECHYANTTPIISQLVTK